MLVKVFGSAVHGVEAITITMEVDTQPGTQIGYSIVGLPDNAVKESIDRIISVIKNNGYERPRNKILVNMAPADIKKAGAAYDVPIALGMLAVSKQMVADTLHEYVIMGELSLDGTLKPIKGALPIAIQARKEKFKGIILPKENAREAALVNNLDVYGISHIKEATDFFDGKAELKATTVNTREEFFDAQQHFDVDFNDVKGQENVKRALGGGGNPQPGEISLAHNGVLFLDELPEFKRSALEVMRQPMEERKVNISRAKVSLDFPASFMLIASMNPCPCGYFNHPEKECSCGPIVVQRYLNKISGPLLDRIDLHVEVTPVSFTELSSERTSEPSDAIRTRVIKARDIQDKRFENNEGIYCNAQMGSKLLKEICVINNVGQNLLKTAMDRLNLSARAYDRILKVSRTIADLADSQEIRPEHLAEAIQYRSLDREGWAG